MRTWAIALLTAALAGPAAAGGLPVRLLAPADGETFVAGSPLVVAWEPAAGFAALGEVDEWEAFLSLDGGRSWPLRLTPELDLDLRRFEVTLPEVASDDARLMLHLGGHDRASEGRREVEVELPHRLRLVPPVAAPSALAVPPVYVEDAGQAARAGGPGVVAWVEGSRRGEERRWVATRPPPRAGRGVADPTAVPPYAALSEPPPADGQGSALALAAAEPPPSTAVRGRPCDRPAPPSPRSRLSLLQRLNE